MPNEQQAEVPETGRVGFNLAKCRQVIWKEPWERAQFYYSVIRNKILLREEKERWVLIL